MSILKEYFFVFIHLHLFTSIYLVLSLQKSIKLEVLLQRFITPEIVQNVECPGCTKIQAQKTKRQVEEGGGDAGPLYLPLDENPRSNCMKKLTIGKVRKSQTRKYHKLSNRPTYESVC